MRQLETLKAIVVVENYLPIRTFYDDESRAPDAYVRRERTSTRFGRSDLASSLSVSPAFDIFKSDGHYVKQFE